MKELLDTGSVMDAIGGNVAVAELTGATPKAAWNWRGFETFPSNTYVAMTRALEAKGFSAPASLWGMKNVDAPTDPERAA
jgi:hypothetical protein